MPGKLRGSLSHLLLSYLYALGMLLTLLGITSLSYLGPVSALVLLLLTVVLSASGLSSRMALTVGGASAAALLGWLLLGGFGTLVEVLRAVSLHMSGLYTALPMVAMETAMILCVLCAAGAYFLTYRSAGAFPALGVLVLTLLLLWLSDQTQVLWCLLPSVLSSVALLLQSNHGEASLRRVMPMAAVLTALTFTGVAVGGATIGPMKDAADELRQRIYDHFFFTGPRDVFSLATEGYYPQGQNQLGGPAEPHTNPVMTVLTPRRTYLRGVIKNVYTGRSWLDDTGGRRYLWSSPRHQDMRREAFDMDLPDTTYASDTARLTPYAITVQMVNESASSMFVPQRIRSLSPGDGVVPYFNVGSEVFATRNLQADDVWTVEAPLFTSADTGVRELVNAASAAADANYEDILKAYTLLPDHLENEVYQLAQSIVSGIDDPYERALAIQRYLQSNYAYKLDVPEQPPELDFVSTFLLLRKEGYCTYFASAMTVLCRMAGLPARYIEGYVAEPDATGVAVVTGEDGHAWTEVYFSGFGWLTFDATPTSNTAAAINPDDLNTPPESSNNEEAPTPTPTATPTPTPEPQREEEQPTPSPEPDDASTPSPAPTDAPNDALSAAQNRQGGFPWWLLILAAAAGVILRILWTQPAQQSRRQKTEFARWIVWTQAIHDALRISGFIRQAAESPIAYFTRVDETHTLPLALSSMGEAESLMFYGHAEPLPEETAQAQSLYRALSGAMKPTRRLLLTLRRAFLPAKMRDLRQ